jgi:ferredoxin-fold anticodon binding domain-containing protein
MKDTITDHQLLLIRQCKKNTTTLRSLRRIVGWKCALSFCYVQKGHVAYALLDIVDDYDLIDRSGFKFKEFILQTLNPKKWWSNDVKDYTDNLIEQLISIIANSEISKFPRYKRSLKYKNQNPE